ncbi:hypothetical protein [Caballeronia sp. SBC2]|uniref:hypothetical protein n=1 Tax=unclassified Caballeronia TaxID=2646786 RepID=UPI00351A5524
MKNYRERRVRGFRDPERTQASLSSFGPIRQYLALERHPLRPAFYRKQLGERFARVASLHESFAKIRPAFEEIQPIELLPVTCGE